MELSNSSQYNPGFVFSTALRVTAIDFSMPVKQSFDQLKRIDCLFLCFYCYCYCRKLTGFQHSEEFLFARLSTSAFEAYIPQLAAQRRYMVSLLSWRHFHVDIYQNSLRKLLHWVQRSYAFKNYSHCTFSFTVVFWAGYRAGVREGSHCEWYAYLFNRHAIVGCQIGHVAQGVVMHKSRSAVFLAVQAASQVYQLQLQEENKNVRTVQLQSPSLFVWIRLHLLPCTLQWSTDYFAYIDSIAVADITFSGLINFSSFTFYTILLR